MPCCVVMMTASRGDEEVFAFVLGKQFPGVGLAMR